MKKYLFFLLLLLILFFVKGFLTLDPDLGWRIAIGEYIFKFGIPRHDPFSYTMSSFPLIDHEWLTHYIMAIIYSKLGLIWLNLFFAVLALIAILLQVGFKRNYWTNTIVFLCCTTLLTFTGMRPQAVGWFFFSLEIYILLKKDNKKLTVFFPLIFLFWANMHGSFILGLVILSIYTLSQKIELKAFVRNLALLLSCTLITLINPFGLGIWERILSEMLMQLNNPVLRWSLQEWYPAWFFPLPSLWLFIALSVTVVIRYRKKLLARNLIIFFLLLLAGISSIRQIPFWLIFAIPITITSLLSGKKDVTAFLNKSKCSKKKYLFIIGILLVSISLQLLFELQKSLEFTENNYYPKNAVAYLKRQKIHGELFSIFQWNGYILWRLPNKKVYIDGMMTTWQNRTAPVSESDNVYVDYLQLMRTGSSLTQETQKYNIQMIILPNVQLTLTTHGSFLTSHIKELQTNEVYYYYIFIRKLQSTGWQKTYQDENTVVYRKVK